MIITFNKAREQGQNPFVGFTTFQHFKDEKLYSDCIVDPNGHSVETENYECYPPPDCIEENGRSQGFYPDGKIAYIRILWKDFEPERKKYNYELIKSVLDEAERHSQTVMFRLMPHSTCARDDVPDWLKKEIFCPGRPLGKRVKESPTDLKYIKYFGEAVRELGKKFDSDPRLDTVDISLSGCWGEARGNCNYPLEVMQDLMDIYSESFTNTKLLGQVDSPDLTKYVFQTHPVGWRGDGTGSDYHMNTFFPGVAEELKDLWKTAPVSFEAFYWLGEWYRRNWDIDSIIEKTLSWHISSFNGKSFPVPFEWKNKIDYWLDRMGYHFYMKQAEASDTAKDGKIHVKIIFENTGVAPIYNETSLRCLIKTSESNIEITPASNDVKTWLPGEEHTVEFDFEKPDSSYGVYFGMTSGKDVIYLCNENVEKDGTYLIYKA